MTQRNDEQRDMEAEEWRDTKVSLIAIVLALIGIAYTFRSYWFQ